jgi:hypothetical protein
MELKVGAASVFRNLENIVTFIFSSAVSLFVAVIVSGKFLTKATRYRDGSGDFLSLQLTKRISLTANNAEVSFGFGAYLATLALNILFFGEFLNQRMMEVAGFSKDSKWASLTVG